MHHHRVLRFITPAVAEGVFLPTSLRGEERIGEGFRFTVEVVAKADGPDPDPLAVLSQPATLEILQGSGNRHDAAQWRPIRGMLAEFAETAHGQDWVRYRAVLVPTMWALSLARQTRVHQRVSVPEVVRTVLAEHGISGSLVEWNLQSRYAVRDYLLQYQEDDLTFIKRLCEDEGISWFHRHDASASVVVFTDHVNGWPMVSGDSTIPYRPSHAGGEQAGPNAGARAANDWHQQEVVEAFAKHQQQVEKSIVVNDWNYRTPDHDLRAEVAVADRAVGQGSTHFGTHHLDSGEACRIAGLRAEEVRCRQVRFVGVSDQRGFRAGHRFTLESHPRPAFAVEYVVVAIVHEATQALDGGEQASTHYTNSFTAHPASQIYRPALTAIRPQVAGVLHARIDAVGSGTYAELDEAGRYQVKLACDATAAPAGGASRPVRMAQPYGGRDHGMHLPLHKSTEVLLLHVNGDPDRPVIAGVVPNPDTPSVVTSTNNTQAILRTAGGNELRFEDLQGKEQVFVHATRDRFVEVVHHDTTTVGGDQRLTVAGTQHTAVAAASHVAIGAALQLSVGAAMNESVGGAKMEEVGGAKYETVAGERTLDVGGSLSVTITGDHIDESQAVRTLKAKKIRLIAEQELILQVGKASLIMKSDGSIRLDGSTVLITTSGSISGKAGGKVVLAGATSRVN